MSGLIFPLMKPVVMESVRETVEKYLVALGRPELAAEWRKGAG